MAEKKTDVKRKSISKKLRFEVFKRDMFTCQYCGRKAPDVVLHIDHIKPVSKGGRNEIMNLVTSCIDCNLGKGAKTLSDQSVVERQRKQAEYLAQRREQIEMLRNWQLEMLEQENLEIDAVDTLVKKLTDGKKSLSEHGRNSTVRPLLKKYGLQFVMDSLHEGFITYNSDIERTLNKLSGICICRADPAISERSHLLNIMNKKFDNFNRGEASSILRKGYEIGGQDFYEDAKETIRITRIGSWYSRRDAFYELLENWEA